MIGGQPERAVWLASQIWPAEWWRAADFGFEPPYRLLNPNSLWKKWECAGKVLFSQGPGLENKSLATPAEGVCDKRHPPAEVFDALFAQLCK